MGVMVYASPALASGASAGFPLLLAQTATIYPPAAAGVQETTVLHACQVWRTLYVAQVGSVVQNHLHCWGAVPPVTAALRERVVPTTCGDGGVAVTVTVMGVTV
jgi:hypothetical protein